MTTGDLLVGMEIRMGCQRVFDFIKKARVEAIGVDWAVLRDRHGRPFFATATEIIYLEVWDENRHEDEE